MRVADFPLTGAEAAIDWAHIVDIKECPVGVSVCDVRYFAVVFFVEGVLYTGANEFLGVRDDPVSK